VEFDERAHVGRSALRFAELLGATDLPENRPQLFLDERPAEDGSIVFAPGGGYAEKCWPLENFVALAGLLTDFPITVIGGEHDRAAGACIARAGSHVTDRTGQLSLRESFAAIASARLVVCNSSVAMHAAAAFRKPALVLLGPAFSSAAQHAAQWGYPETCVLGQASPEQAHEHLQRTLTAAR
jgi:heptosyltransferase-2